ncbi:SGNH/GDSL hydrolase family protein [Solicola sp. PLA-1-18]|uniref:SGNH/GDSL hydrolase family protein n=1 Tax=Solicola sp. PLA-1-18 TaxID=3380532 RepID=UPI003B7FD00A
MRIRPARAVTAAVTALAAAALALVPTGSASAGTERPYDDYVALGDSFTAGPLVPLQRLDPLGCARSTRNYPAYLASYLRVASYTDVSCSAAETGDMTAPQSTFAGTNPAQLDALDAGTDLVTLGIGGNDFSLFGDLIEVCQEVRDSDPDGTPCKDRFTVDGVDTKLRDAAAIQARVAGVLDGIEQRSPDARVVVVGYLNLLPEVGTCAAVPFATGDYAWGRQVQAALNASLRDAAADAGATFVDLDRASYGHDACAGREAWVNGATTKPLRALYFHPFAKGMRGVAAESYRTLTGQPAPTGLAPRSTGAPTGSVDTDRLAALLEAQVPR